MHVKSLLRFFFVSVAVVAVPSLSHASLSSSDQSSILTGITASDTVFYAIGGGILVVLAGIWGFKKVQGLMSSDDSFDWDPDADEGYTQEYLDSLSDAELDDLWANSEEVK